MKQCLSFLVRLHVCANLNPNPKSPDRQETGEEVVLSASRAYLGNFLILFCFAYAENDKGVSGWSFFTLNKWTQIFRNVKEESFVFLCLFWYASQLDDAVFHVISSRHQPDVTPSAAMSWIRDVPQEMPEA